MTSELLVGISGIVLSVGFSYIPGLRTWYAAKSEEFKKLFMLGLLVLVTGAAFGLGCAGLVATGIVCTWMGAWQLAGLLITAIVSNQSIYKISPQTADVRAINAKQLLTEAKEQLPEVKKIS